MLKSGTLNPLKTLLHCILVGFHNRTPTQRVFINQNSSKSFNIDCGVPQGSYSGLGPILFIMYLGGSTSLRTTYLVSICMQMISGEEKLSCSIFSVVLYSARIMLGAEGACSFPYISGGNVKLQHFLSRTLFGKHHVKGKERTVFLTSG